jgi:hypothetical protein
VTYRTNYEGGAELFEKTATGWKFLTGLGGWIN